jgi:hypothetical protein
MDEPRLERHAPGNPAERCETGVTTRSRSSEELLQEIADGDFSGITALMEDPARARKATGLEAEASLLVEIAALAAVDAPPISWLHLLTRNEATLDMDKVVGALISVTPIIGAPRAVSAAGNILGATEFEEELDEEP